MEYRAVGNRCAITFHSHKIEGLPPDEACVAALRSLGFIPLAVDIVALARSYLGHSNWRRKSTIKDAPRILNCSVFTKYLFGQAGIWIPRLGVQQREFGTPIVLEEASAGDLIFVEGHHAFHYADPADGVGHVGLVTESKTVIHAGGPDKCVNEIPLRDFLEICGTFRGIRRHVPKNETLYTFLIPEGKEIEYSDDLRWVIMKYLFYRK